MGHLEDEICQADLDEYRRIGYPILLTSSVTGEGLEELRQTLKGTPLGFCRQIRGWQDRLVECARAGAGLARWRGWQRPDRQRQTYHLGRRNGLRRRLARISSIRPACANLACTIWTATTWPCSSRKCARWLGQCKFGLDCSHDEEPGCAIRQAVMAGKISPLRYQSYLRLKEEV